MPSFRNIIRWIFLALALAFIAWTAPDVFHDLRGWRAAVPGDPVAAAFWRSAFYAEAGNVTVVLATAVLIWLALKPRKRAAAPSAQL